MSFAMPAGQAGRSCSTRSLPSDVDVLEEVLTAGEVQLRGRFQLRGRSLTAGEQEDREMEKVKIRNIAKILNIRTMRICQNI